MTKDKILFATAFLFLISYTSDAQFKVDYNPAIQPTGNMQYFTPAEGNLFVGDCIPFSHNGTYYLYWLIDKDHHKSMNGLGGHQWVLSTSTDLKNWKHFPVVIGIDEEWEKSICTGSLVYTNKKFYAFYATRLLKDGKSKEQLSYAVSTDGIHFKKQLPNPFYESAPGYSSSEFRDPKVILDSSGTFNLLISTKENNAVLPSEAGCIVRLSSKDLKNWDLNPPLITGQNAVPECPDHFYWNGWYYIVYGINGDTYYLKSKSRYGPWESPKNQALKEQFSNVAKTASFGSGRRIAAAWIPSRLNNKDQGYEDFGGSAVFRELIQLEDGTLGTKFPSEMIPETKDFLKVPFIRDTKEAEGNESVVNINAANGLGTGYFENVPVNCRITMEIEPLGTNDEFGFYLRSNAKAEGGYKLNFSSSLRKVMLGNTSIEAVEGLNNAIKVDIIMKGDIIDVCIDNKRCIVNRTPEQKGQFLWLYTKQGNVTFKSIKIAELK